MADGEAERLDTAHEYWDAWWQEARGRALWGDPDPMVLDFIPTIRRRGSRVVLDVGTGIGRHALAYARVGFEVVATDASATGLEELAKSAKAQQLEMDTRLATFTKLPVDEASIDHVLAWNVLYHGDGDIVAAGLSECRRVLREGGTAQLTMLSKRHRCFGVGDEVRPNTFVDPSSRGDKDHPHFYVNEDELTQMMTDEGFSVVSLCEVDQQPPDGWHWAIVAETR